LNVVNPHLNLAGLRSVVQRGVLPRSPAAIVYTTSTAVLIMRWDPSGPRWDTPRPLAAFGRGARPYLQHWLLGPPFPGPHCRTFDSGIARRNMLFLSGRFKHRSTRVVPKPVTSRRSITRFNSLYWQWLSPHPNSMPFACYCGIGFPRAKRTALSKQVLPENSPPADFRFVNQPDHTRVGWSAEERRACCNGPHRSVDQLACLTIATPFCNVSNDIS
jgi:hypothetical protein